MRFDLTRPCGDCPFRSDIHFGLRPERVREILGDPDGHQWWPAPSFPCHKTIEYTDAGTIIPPTAQQCAGVMAILHRENRPNTAMQLAERFGMWNPAKLDPSAPFYGSTRAAIDGQEPLNDDAKRRAAEEAAAAAFAPNDVQSARLNTRSK